MVDQEECLPLINDEDIINNCGPIEIPPPPALIQTLDASGPRLMITHIVAENFKSYGGRRVMGPFHKNFTCVIGPNGSGKSNVIDAMLFVFGYRASKVRSKKLSQLVHNSELISNPKGCMVAVHFQKIVDTGVNSLDFEVVPNSHFVVSRRAFRDNSSMYYIDDSRAVYRDVANLLRCHGIDLDHNRFLILQGEVEQIALMKPKAPSEHEDGFLEYLEDIIGSSRFKKPLTIYDNRIERLSDLRLEKVARVKAVEKEKDELEDVRNEAVGYLQLVNKSIQFKNILYQQKLSNDRLVCAEIKEKLDQARSQVQTCLSTIQENSQQLNQTELERDELIGQLSLFQAKHRDTKAKFSQFEAEDGRLRDEHAHTKAAGRRLMKAIQIEQNKLEELNKLPDEAGNRREEIKNRLNELEDTRKKHEEVYKETMNNLDIETAPLRTKVEKAETVLAPLQSEADELNSKLTLEREQFELLMAGQKRERDRAKHARDEIEQITSTLSQRSQELVVAQRQLMSEDESNSSLKGRKSNLESALQKANRDLSEAKSRETELIKQQTSLRSKIAEIKSNLQSDNSRSRVLTALLEAKRANKLGGILGRLGDLGSIASKYDVAISTACGALDNVVTDTMESAQKAVTFLKQNNLGQATFIALDKMSKWSSQADHPFQLPKGSFEVERLFDLVQTTDPKIKLAFYYALRDTLVTKHLEMATKIAFGNHGQKPGQRYRVVTLEGQLIEASGAMSGGGGRPLSGRIMHDLAMVRRFQQDSIGSVCQDKNPTNSSLDLSSLEKQLIQHDNELAQVRESRYRHEELVQRMTKSLEDAHSTIKRCTVDCERFKARIQALMSEAEKADARAKTIGPSVAVCQKMENELKSLEKLTNQKNTKVIEQKEQVEKLKAQLLDVGSARITAVRSRLDAIEKKTKETNDQLTKLEVSIKTASRNKDKSENKLKSLESELESERNKLLTVDNKLKQVEEDARLCMVEFQQIKSKMEELQSSKDRNQTVLNSLEATLSDLRKQESIARRQVEQLDSDLNQTLKNIRHFERELRGLRLHKIDDDDDLELDQDRNSVCTTKETSSSIINNELNPTISNGDDAVSKSPNEPRTKEKSLKLPTYTPEQLKDMVVDQNEMQKINDRLANMAPNMAAIEEYRRKTENYLTRVSELKHITNLLVEQRKQREDAKMKRLNEFLDGFHTITNKLKEMYQMITQGGDAELELIDSLDPFSEGIVFSVRPPKKSWKNISNLSGGEKTLSSLALVFALHHYRPTPLYVMDEIDAALDFKNVSIVGNYLKERTRNAQFLVISLRSNMFELSDRLVGIYKTYNMTKTVTLDPSTLGGHLERLIARVGAACGRQVDLGRLLSQQQNEKISPHKRTLEETMDNQHFPTETPQCSAECGTENS